MSLKWNPKEPRHRQVIHDNRTFLTNFTKLNHTILTKLHEGRIITSSGFSELVFVSNTHGTENEVNFLFYDILISKDAAQYKLFYELMQEAESRQTEQVLRMLKQGLEESTPVLEVQKVTTQEDKMVNRAAPTNPVLDLQISAKDILWISRKLSKIAGVVGDLNMFSGYFEVLHATYEEIRRKDRIEGPSNFGVIKMILGSWLDEEEGGRTLNDLIQVLRDGNYNSAIGEILKSPEVAKMGNQA